MTTREQAIVALENRLATITVANGYAVEVKKVQRSTRTQLLYENGYPAVAVVDTGDSDIQYKTGGLADIYTVVKLVCYVRGRTAMSSRMNELDLAIKKAIAADPTLAGAVAHATIQGDADKDLSGDDDVASFTRPIRLFYEGSYSGGM